MRILVFCLFVRQARCIRKFDSKTCSDGSSCRLLCCRQCFGYESARQKRNTISADASLASLGEEGYTLQVDGKGIVVKAATEAGLFYGQQTLLQLLTPDGIPYVKIEDAPRFPYRGLHLDVSRHIFSEAELLKLIDVMSSYKMNRLHLHLTDAGGWRLQIDKYPKLTSQAAYRTESDWRKWWDGKERKYVPEGTEGAYGGYYTKEQMKKVVAYAAEKHIVVIPEIEFPGHSEEVFAAYPGALLCRQTLFRRRFLCR